MSISGQVKELREWANCVHQSGHNYEILTQAADTIESLSAKLQAENCGGGGWIYCDEWLPAPTEYMEKEATPYLKRLEIAYRTDTIEYAIGFYDGSKWMDKHHNIIENVVAWKPFLKLPGKHHEP